VLANLQTLHIIHSPANEVAKHQLGRNRSHVGVRRTSSSGLVRRLSRWQWPMSRRGSQDSGWIWQSSQS